MTLESQVQHVAFEGSITKLESDVAEVKNDVKDIQVNHLPYLTLTMKKVDAATSVHSGQITSLARSTDRNATYISMIVKLVVGIALAAVVSAVGIVIQTAMAIGQ